MWPSITAAVSQRVWFGEGWAFTAEVKTDPDFLDKTNYVDTLPQSGKVLDLQQTPSSHPQYLGP